MRVVESRWGPVRGTLPQSVGNARRQWQHRAGLVLALRDEDGRLGFGEASPLPGYSSESLESCQNALQDLVPRSFVLSETEDLIAGTASVSAPLGRTPAARFALETALLDLAGQRSGRPVHALLATGPARAVRRCGLVDGTVSTWVTATRALLGRNIRTIKLKIERQDFDRLTELRASVPGDWSFRLDVNGAWSVEEARLCLELLAPLKPEFVEQPTAPETLSSLGRCSVPWAADESLRHPQEVERLLTASCAAFVLKPAILGGFTAALEIASRARGRGIHAVASHLFDGPVALAACCELALALASPLAAGVDTHSALLAWPSIPLAQLDQAGEIVPSTLPGLGFPEEYRREILSWIR